MRNSCAERTERKDFFELTILELNFSSSADVATDANVPLFSRQY